MRTIPTLLVVSIASLLAACGGHQRTEPAGNVTVRNLGPSQLHFAVLKTADRSFALGDIQPKVTKVVQVDAPVALYIEFQDDFGHPYSFTLDQTRLNDGGHLDVRIKNAHVVEGSGR